MEVDLKPEMCEEIVIVSISAVTGCQPPGVVCD